MPPRHRPPEPIAASHSEPPEQPIEFWQHPVMRAALQSRHIGHVIRAYRTHPWHARDITQKQTATWLRMDQAHLSRIENGPTPGELGKLAHWATVLKIPPELLWFQLPAPRPTAPTNHGPGGNQRLQRLRHARNWTPDDVAARLRKHIHATTGRHPVIDARAIERLETGEITHLPPEYRTALRAIYAVTTDEQLGLNSDNPAPPETAAPAQPRRGLTPAPLSDTPAPGIGELIRTLRHRRGWSQDDLADALATAMPGSSITRNEISRYESETRMPKTDRIYHALAEALQTPETELRAATRRSWAERRTHRYGPPQPAWKRDDPTPPQQHTGQHLGDRLAELRRARNLTQEALAERAGVSVDVVRKLEQHRKDAVRLPTLHKLATGLAIDPATLLTEPPATSSTNTDAELELSGIRSHFGEAQTTMALHPDQDEASHSESQNVERRRFLTATGTAAASSVLPAPKRVVQALDIILSEDADTLGTAVDSLNELVAHYSEVLPSSPPASIYDDLLSVRSYASTLLRRSMSTRHHSDLVVATGWLSNLLAVTTSYMGDHGTALVWCSDAERRSDESGHPDLAGWATLSRSMIAYYKGQADRSATLASRGQHSTTAGSVINVKLAAQEMRASAMVGNADVMEQARRRAVKALTRLPIDVARSGAFSIALAEEPPYTATSLLLVGKFDEAASVTRNVIEAAYPASVRHRAEKSSSYARTLLILALAEAGRGRVGEAVAAGRAALDGADVVWPTLVLAGKLDRVLMHDFKDAEETTGYHALYSDAASNALPGSSAPALI
jgi:transcriptional regulator with XRE-family HTH domain